jgi:phosphoglucomutase
LIGDFVRDKDAVSACCLMAELAAQAITEKSYAFKELLKIYKEYGLYKEDLLSITKKGKDGLEEIKKMMFNYRNHPPVEINNSKVVMIKDYWEQVSINCETGVKTPISLPQSDVLQFFTADDTKITIRPSGTEPKIKFYFAVKGELHKFIDFDHENQKLADKIKNVIQSLQLN